LFRYNCLGVGIRIRIGSQHRIWTNTALRWLRIHAARSGVWQSALNFRILTVAIRSTGILFVTISSLNTADCHNLRYTFVPVSLHFMAKACPPISQLVFVLPLKERGHYYMCYTYVTVFVRNAANLAHILPKASRTTFT
jgi:hypothetical protein